MRDPREQWKLFGRLDPYYGVLSGEEFRRENLTQEALERFYATGSEHVETALPELREWRPSRALDFGCGVGRIVIPLADRCDEVVGLDVSPDALAEARRQCAARGITNTEFYERLPAGLDFDLIHSTIVLQHIPAADGYGFIADMVDRLRPGGLGVLQFPVGARLPTAVFYRAQRSSTFAAAWNLGRGRRPDYPSMQMNVYKLPRVLAILQARGIAHSSVEFTAAESATSLDAVVLRFRRPG